MTLEKQSWYWRIEVWILFFFLLRLIGIIAPPLEIAHNWRQVTGLMVARNFYEGSSSLFFPAVDETNGGSGIIGMEFPFLNYLHFLTAKVFGFQDWYGRLINLVVSSLGILAFEKLVKHYFNSNVSFMASMALCVSIFFSFSRKMMPDTFCIALVLIGMYFLLNFFKKGGAWSYIFFFIFIGLGFLSKISSLLLLVPIAYMILMETSLKHKMWTFLSLAVALSLTFYWYFVWNPFLALKYGSWYNSGVSLTLGFYQIKTHLLAVLAQFYFSAFHGFIFFFLSFSGLLMLLYKKRHKEVLFFLLTALLFGVYILKSGEIFFIHSYYIVPFVPFMALLVGVLLAEFTFNKWVFIILISASVESIANQQHDFFIHKEERYKLTLEETLYIFSGYNDLIAINGNGNPQQLYFTHRKGWNTTDALLQQETYLDQIKRKGCKYVVLNKASSFTLNKDLVYSDDHYLLYRLQ